MPAMAPVERKNSAMPRSRDKQPVTTAAAPTMFQPKYHFMLLLSNLRPETAGPALHCDLAATLIGGCARSVRLNMVARSGGARDVQEIAFPWEFRGWRRRRRGRGRRP